jgi:hypothetical protein
MSYFIRLALILLPFSGFAQQNLFNMPSGDITPKREYFYQHQLNVYQNKFESKGHFVYGLGNNFDAGLNLVGKGAYYDPEWKALYNPHHDRGALFPFLMGTIQKQWKIHDYLLINLGSQVGINVSKSIEHKRPGFFHYGLAIFPFMKGKSRLVTGAYYTNAAYVGKGNKTGMMLGYEIKLSKRWYLMGDWISGRNEQSGAVTGFMFNAGRRAQLCAGWQIPNRGSIKQQALVLELNILGWDLY